MIVAVGSGKGGVGKTWLGITLAQSLARHGRRVLLVDGDLGLANVDIQLGLDPVRDLGAVIAGRCRLEDAVQPFAPGGFDVVPGRSGSGRLAALASERLAPLLDDLRRLAKGYDLTIVDLPAGIDHVVRRFMQLAGRRLVVTSDEPTALTDAYALIKVAAQDGARDFETVINLAPGHAAGAATHDGLARVCGRFLGLEPGLAGVIRRDPRVADAIREQTPLLTRHPASPAAKDVLALAAHLLRSF